MAASGSYGIVKGGNFDPAQHADVFLSYCESRASISTGFTLVDSSTYLTKQTIGSDVKNTLDGVYNLKLPLDVFNKVGIYTIYIRPKQITTTIQDVGVLSAYPDVRGIVLKTGGDINFDNEAMVGYRIEYYDATGTKVDNLFRIVTSNNRCEPINQNITSANQKSVRYRFNDSSDLMFLTLTPSSSSNIKPNSIPYIGNTSTTIILSNTFFNPVMVEIEMTDNDIESLYTSMNGNQIRTLDKGLVTTYDKNNNIFNQAEHYIIKETATGTPTYEVKENKTIIDFTQDHNTIIGNV